MTLASAPYGAPKEALKPLVPWRLKSLISGTYEVSLKSELFGTRVPGFDRKRDESWVPFRRACGR